MAHNYSISEFGLKLIKAYEGFRPVATNLVSGQKVIGYGHIFMPGDMAMLNKRQAEDLLQVDLAPFEALVNSNVYAPLSQSQFDALVSLSYNIGEEAFLNSSVLYHLNTGQSLAAAAGFDEWRKSVIGGKTYIVDALVRRRTAEKALFLRPATGIVATPRHELPPMRVQDEQGKDAGMDVFETTNAAGFVGQTPYSVGDVEDASIADDAADRVLNLSDAVVDEPEPTENNLSTEYIIGNEEIITGEVNEHNISEYSVSEDDAPEDGISGESFTENPLETDETVLFIQSLVDENNAADLQAENPDDPSVALGNDAGINETDIIDEILDENTSPIAVAAAQVSERLDRLIEGEQSEEKPSPDNVENDLPSQISEVQTSEVQDSDMASDDTTAEISDESKKEASDLVGEAAPNLQARQHFGGMKLVEMDIPGNIDYNLQTPETEGVEAEIVGAEAPATDASEINENAQDKPLFNLVTEDKLTENTGDLEEGLPVHDVQQEEPEPITEFSETAQDIQNDAPLTLQDGVMQEDALHGVEAQNTIDVQKTIDEHGDFVPREPAPIAALQNPAPNLVAKDKSKNKAGFWIAPVIGLFLLGGGLWKTKFSTPVIANEWNAYIAPVALLVGGLILFGGLYYLLKALLPRNMAN